jgi:creatinine amidohydrolase
MKREESIGLLKARMDLARERLREISAQRVEASPPPPFPWIVTGIGSSEAHARFLCSLVARIAPGAATFAHPSSFAVSSPSAPGGTLIVFSQGLSANARIALCRRSSFARTVVFTTKEKSETSFTEEDTEFVRCAETDEFTILLRVIGPMVTYLTAWQWLHSVLPGIPAPPDSTEVERIFSSVDETSRETVDALAGDFIAGVEFNFIGPANDYPQNLGFKRVEGLFLSEPIRRDILQAAHGPLQQNHAKPCAQWIFTSASPAETALAAHLRPMFGRLDAPIRTIASPAPEPASVFFFEALLNRVLATAIDSSPHSQFDWPGKGLDGEGYQLECPLPAAEDPPTSS